MLSIVCKVHVVKQLKYYISKKVFKLINNVFFKILGIAMSIAFILDHLCLFSDQLVPDTRPNYGRPEIVACHSNLYSIRLPYPLTINTMSFPHGNLPIY